MAEIKISCPQCSQHIQCDESYGGRQITCPQCQTAFTVPQLTPPKPVLSIAAKRTKTYLVNSGGNQCGPYTVEELKAYLESGKLEWSDLAWCEGMSQWQPLNGIIVPTAFSSPPPLPSSHRTAVDAGATDAAIHPAKRALLVVGIIISSLIGIIFLGLGLYVLLPSHGTSIIGFVFYISLSILYFYNGWNLHLASQGKKWRLFGHFLLILPLAILVEIVYPTPNKKKTNWYVVAGIILFVIGFFALMMKIFLSQ